MKLVADQPGQFQDRAALAGGAQKRLVSHALLVKRQHIGHGRGGVEQRDGEIVIGAAAQLLQRRKLGARQRRQEALFECAMGADAVRESRQAGPVEQPAGRALSHAGAAAALPQAMQRYQGRVAHLPPPTDEIENTMLGEITIVVAAGNFQTAQFQLARGQRLVVGLALALKFADLHRGHARHGLRRGDQWAQINRLSESEVIRMEQTKPAVGELSGAEQLKQLALDVGAEVRRIGANMHVDFQRHRQRPVDFDVMTRHAKGSTNRRTEASKAPSTGAPS